MDVYWSVDQEFIWNASTVQAINILSEQRHPIIQQLVYQTHKTTSAATLKNDVCYLRVRDAAIGSNSDLWSFSVSQFTEPETKANFRRGWVVFGAFSVQPIQPNVCEVSLIWCWDFNGWIHEKFVLEEKKKVALRLSKIGTQVAEYSRNPKSASTYVQPAPSKPASSASSASSTTYSSTTSSSLPVNRPQAQKGILKGCKDCRIPESGNYCSRCGNPTGSVCGKCFASALYSSGTNCNNCGNKLREAPPPSE